MVRFALTLFASLAFLLPHQATAGSPFAQVVLRNFDRWDRHHEGKLTMSDLEWWMTNPALHGEDAAAMALLEKAMRLATWAEAEHKPAHVPEFTRAYFERYDQMTADQRRQEHNFDAFFGGCKNKLAHASRELFPEGMPRRSAIHQGRIGDCCVLAVIGSLVTHRPEEIKRLVEGNSTAGYRLRFPNRPVVHVSPLTDAEVALCGTAGQNGLWLAVLEKGVGEVHREGFKKMRTPEPADALATGPHTVSVAIALLTGHRCETIGIPEPSASHHKLEAAEERLHTLLPHVKRSSRVCVAASRDNRQAPPGMGGHHCYAILGYDVDARRVRLWNPWGNEHTPHGHEGLKEGYATEEGCFEIPLKDFWKEYDAVCLELHEPVAHSPL